MDSKAWEQQALRFEPALYFLLNRCVYTIIGTLATDRPHTFGGGRLFVPAGLSYRFFILSLEYESHEGRSPLCVPRV